ncbi:MAG: hypothetical protein IPP01_11475 [Saprospiraceae bacterium]|nr:hypothetical protein [Saprospiraceae bacterium]
MKNLLLFILILLNKLLCACGYYPYGEATRISLFNPEVFGYSTYSNFYYSADLFTPNEGSSPKEFVEQNTKFWFEYCNKKVDIPSIDIAIYKLREAEIDTYSENQMIKYLYHHHDSDALNYLRFAKNCEFFNSWREDPWERNSFLQMPKREELINRAITLANKVKNENLKERYTFIAIRLAWYNKQYDKIQSLFATVFEKKPNKDILYYWSLYFKTFAETNKARANFDLAQIFANAIDKRFVCHQNYRSNVPLEQTLKFAKTKIEKSNVYLFYGIEKPDKAIACLQKMYVLNPSSDGLSFLLLREINKIEDFVFTPYYTLFQPSISYDYWENNGHTSTRQVLIRSEKDRMYANEVLQFINSVNINKVENPFLWKCCKSHLLFIKKNYNACLITINQLEKLTPDTTIINQLQIFKTLSLIARQKKGSAIIPKEVQSTILANQKNGQFIFAIGKELEYLENNTDAAIFFSKLDNSWEEKPPLFWKTTKSRKHSYTEYFENYFEYIDVVYTPEQIQRLINDIQRSKTNTSRFEIFKYQNIQSEVPRLYDLLGTKYIRQNKLENAASAFNKIEYQYWDQNYTAWSENNNIFNENPFYNFKYTPKFIFPKDTFLLNKYTITKQLINFLHKAEDNREKDRDYYYFLAANAYYNMGPEGNISMMRRFNSWSDFYLSDFEDEAEFRQSNLAKKYYLLAKKYAKTDKFKALCLRMLIRCEQNKMSYKYIEKDVDYDYDLLKIQNPFYYELKLKYPKYLDDLVSNCDNFKVYFDGRR